MQISVPIKEQPGRCLRCFAIPFSSFGYIGKLFHSLGSCSNCLGCTDVLERLGYPYNLQQAELRLAKSYTDRHRIRFKKTREAIKFVSVYRHY